MRDRPFPFAHPFASIRTVLIDPSVTPPDQAFIAAIERHREELHRHCALLVRSPADAEDALQETLLRAWRYRGTLASDNPRAARRARPPRRSRSASRRPTAPCSAREPPSGRDST